MTKTEQLNLMKNRVKTMEGSVKNIKCPGVLKALRREVRNLENQTNE